MNEVGETDEGKGRSDKGVEEGETAGGRGSECF